MMKIIDLISAFKNFLRESFESMEEVSISSNMRMEGYTDFEIKMAIDNLRRIREQEKLS